MLRSLQLLLLIFATSVIAGEEDDPVKLPYVEVGDCWSYRTEGYYYHGPIKDYEICIVRIDKDRDLIQGVAMIDKGDRELDASFSLDWGKRTGLAGQANSPPSKFMKFPLRVGDRYPLEFDFRASREGVASGTASWQVTVVGWESVTVPAGTFRAIKIEGNGRIVRSDVVQDLSALELIWYVPNINRPVKSLYISGTIRRTEELTGYRLNK